MQNWISVKSSGNGLVSVNLSMSAMNSFSNLHRLGTGAFFFEQPCKLLGDLFSLNFQRSSRPSV